jgi:hypothetical protein
MVVSGWLFSRLHALGIITASVTVRYVAQEITYFWCQETKNC